MLHTPTSSPAPPPQVRAAKQLTSLRVHCNDPRLWFSSGKDAFIEAVAECKALRSIDFSGAMLPDPLCKQLCQRLASSGADSLALLNAQLLVEATGGPPPPDLDSDGEEEWGHNEKTTESWTTDQDLHYGAPAPVVKVASLVPSPIAKLQVGKALAEGGRWIKNGGKRQASAGVGPGGVGGRTVGNATGRMSEGTTREASSKGVSRIESVSLGRNRLTGCGKEVALLLTECLGLRFLDLSKTSLSTDDGADILAAIAVRLNPGSAGGGGQARLDIGSGASSTWAGEAELKDHVAIAMPTPGGDSGGAEGGGGGVGREASLPLVTPQLSQQQTLQQPPPPRLASPPPEQRLACVIMDASAVPPGMLGRLPPTVAAVRGDALIERQGIQAILNEVARCVAEETLAADSAGAAQAQGACRFSGDARADLRSGTLVEAARGLQHYMCVSEAHIFEGVRMGTAAIVEEVEALGDAEVSSLLRYILHEPASEAVYPNGVRDRGRNGEVLADFCLHRDARLARLEEAHVVALRLYTTSAFQHVNAPLRNPKGAHPLARTTWFIAEAIRRLRAVHADSGAATATEDLWRGMRNLTITDEFMAQRTGGTELAPMSTSTSLAVAASYGASRGTLLFKVKVDNAMVRGASLGWVSAFPTEAEVLFPPLTYLQPTGRRQTVYMGSATFEIVEVQPILSS